LSRTATWPITMRGLRVPRRPPRTFIGGVHRRAHWTASSPSRKRGRSRMIGSSGIAIASCNSSASAVACRPAARCRSAKAAMVRSPFGIANGHSRGARSRRERASPRPRHLCQRPLPLPPQTDAGDGRPVRTIRGADALCSGPAAVMPSGWPATNDGGPRRHTCRRGCRTFKEGPLLSSEHWGHF
jgi:hypothetical protein